MIQTIDYHKFILKYIDNQRYKTNEHSYNKTKYPISLDISGHKYLRLLPLQSTSFPQRKYSPSQHVTHKWHQKNIVKLFPSNTECDMQKCHICKYGMMYSMSPINDVGPKHKTNIASQNVTWCTAYRSCSDTAGCGVVGCG